MTRAAFCFAVASLLCAGCPRPDPAGGLGSVAPPAELLDYDEFVCRVQPILVKRCSYLACHGNADHALRLYSPGKLRRGEAGTRMQRDAQLTAEEVDLNFQSAVGVTAYTTSQTERDTASHHVLLLEKPARAIAGGAEHHGVGVFPIDPSQPLEKDAEWLALARWVAGQKQPSPVDADCQNTFDTLGLTPR